MNLNLKNRLQLTAEEAEFQGMTKLASAITESLSTETKSSSYDDLQDHIHKDLWKVATKLLSYYDLDSIDVEFLDKTLVSWASKISDDLEKALGVSHIVKVSSEEKVPGEQ